MSLDTTVRIPCPKCEGKAVALSEQVRADRGGMSRVIATGCYYK